MPPTEDALKCHLKRAHYSVAIVCIGVYTSHIVIGTGIVYCTRSRSRTVVRGRLATAHCRRRRLPPDGWWSFVVAGES